MGQERIIDYTILWRACTFALTPSPSPLTGGHFFSTGSARGPSVYGMIRAFRCAEWLRLNHWQGALRAAELNGILPFPSNDCPYHRNLDKPKLRERRGDYEVRTDAFPRPKAGR